MSYSDQVTHEINRIFIWTLHTLQQGTALSVLAAQVWERP
jgi:hypothetical protein